MKWRAPTSKKTIWGWALYDFGNSAFTTLIVTFIYAVFFAQEIAPDVDTGTIMWLDAIALTLGSIASNVTNAS